MAFRCPTLMITRSPWLVAAAVVAASGTSGCATSQPRSDAARVVTIRPGVAERIALMDQYRLGDDIRKAWMARPRVWVEEVPDAEGSPPAAEEIDDEGQKDVSEDPPPPAPGRGDQSLRRARPDD
jgi:hypothetical protein